MSARLERITRATSDLPLDLARGVSVITFASSALGAVGFTTGLARLAPSAELGCHYHDCGESITVLEGQCEIAIQGRVYLLSPFDSIHVPANIAHAAKNPDNTGEMLVHSAFSSATVTLTPVEREYSARDLRASLSARDGAESLRRFSRAEEYELSRNAWFTDLFAKRLGSPGICGGYGRFAPGASLPCHKHLYDESISIIQGTATCLVAGRRYTLSDCDTALVPQGLPHRFINETKEEMAMVWVYAGDEPERVIVNNSLCLGEQEDSTNRGQHKSMR